MDLNDFLGPKPIVIDLQAENRWQAIDELVGCLVTNANAIELVKETIRRQNGFVSRHACGHGVADGLAHYLALTQG